MKNKHTQITKEILLCVNKYVQVLNTLIWKNKYKSLKINNKYNKVSITKNIEETCGAKEKREKHKEKEIKGEIKKENL